MHFRTEIRVGRADAANIPERPSRQHGRVRNSRCVGLQEVDFIEWIAVHGTGKKDEKDEKACACD